VSPSASPSPADSEDGFNLLHVLDRQLRASGGPTFGTVLTEWLDYGRTQQGKRWAPRTADDNRSQVENRIRPALSEIPLADLSADHLERQYAVWTDVDGLSDNSVHRFAALISSALSFAVRRRYIAARRVQQPEPELDRHDLNGDPAGPWRLASSTAWSVKSSSSCASIGWTPSPRPRRSSCSASSWPSCAVRSPDPASAGPTERS
jgi:hypothetical protein